MANEKNLRPSEHKFTQEEAKRGGQNSGKARREKKTFRELAQIILELQPKDKELKKSAKAFGLDNPNNKELAVIGLTLSAINGNHHAFDRLLALSGEGEQSSGEQEKQKQLLDAIEKAVQDAD